ncbi:MAG: FecCD family ABC transporter permease [bacterium]
MQEKQPGISTFKTLVIVAVLAVVLVASVLWAVTIGPVGIPLKKVIGVLLNRLPLVSNQLTGTLDSSTLSIVWEIRFPRVLMSVVVGAGLSVVGAALQALVRNPLADPYILGISSGASVGAALVIVFGVFSFLGTMALSVAACMGAFVTLMGVFFLAREGNRVPVVRLLLAGIAMSAILSALTSLIMFLSPQDSGVAAVYFWIMGSLSGASWGSLPIPVVVVTVGVGVLMIRSEKMNLMLMGDDTAATLGLEVSRFRKFLLAHSTILTGVIVAVSGAIGFVGLIVPHIVRMIMGANHRRLIPVAALLGGIFLVWADVLARMILAPQELPIGIITSLTGGPFFIWLMRQKTYRFGDGA